MLYVVGGGLAGLAASVAATKAGAPVTLFEATGHAGGRCRSFFDAGLGAVIDNGTHLLLNANRNALNFARGVGGIDSMHQGPAHFPFINLQTGARWTLTPMSLLKNPWDLARALGLVGAKPHATVAQTLGATSGYHTLWDPLSVATLNTMSDQASAKQFARMMRVAVTMGLSALKPWIFPQGLSAALVEPAVATLKNAGGILHFNRRLKAVSASELRFEGQTIHLMPEDKVIMALPPWATHDFFPHLPIMETEAIINAHYRLNHSAVFDHGLKWMGATAGLAQWLSIRGDVVSVTLSAANNYADVSNEQLGTQIWAEIAPLLGAQSSPRPAYRIIRERRATIAHTPTQVPMRPLPCDVGGSIILAGDWLESPLPCTIEAAITSGLRAAEIALDRSNLRFMS